MEKQTLRCVSCRKQIAETDALWAMLGGRSDRTATNLTHLKTQVFATKVSGSVPVCRACAERDYDHTGN
jgi:hypothetical protein